MDKVDIFGYGWTYEIILGLLAFSFIIDAVSIVKSFRGGLEDIKEYAELFVKYLKILMHLFAGGFFIYVGLTYGLDAGSTAVHLILGALLIADAIVCMYIKLRYGKRSGK